MRVTLAAQCCALRLQLILHEPESRQDHRVQQRFARQSSKRKPLLSRYALLFRPLLANLPHGGSPPFGNPIFRSGEVCRHSIFNSYPDIPGTASSTAVDGTRHFPTEKRTVRSRCLPSGADSTKILTHQR